MNEHNPLLQKIVIQPIIRPLPSRGLLYQNDELDSSVKNGEIKIYPLTGIDEIKLKSPDLMLSGEGTVEVIKNRCPQIHKVEEMFVQDIDYILFQMRIASYGDQYEVEYSHPNCPGSPKDPSDEKQDKSDVNKRDVYRINLNEMLNQIRYIQPDQVTKQFTNTMSTGQTVKFKPLRLKHLIQLMNDIPKEQTEQDVAENTVESLVQIIEQVDDITDKDLIKEWLHDISVTDWNKLNKQVQQLSDWGIEYKHETNCKKCNEKIKVPVVTNPLIFFTQP